MEYTQSGYRIQRISQGSEYQWLFLPGGPGLGSEYLVEFCKQLQLPGSISLLDFPMDGTNTQGKLDFSAWKKGLIDLLKIYANPILVTHSFSGMFVMQHLQEMEAHLTGLVLMNTTTLNSFIERVNAMHIKHGLPDLVPPASAYHLNPSRKLWREFWDTYKFYCFTSEELSLGDKMISLFAFNNDAYQYAIQHFFPHYACQFSSVNVPTLTISSENDFVCPPQIFFQDERFQSDNVINRMIEKAGHYPWVLHFEEVQECFNEFLTNLIVK